MVGIESRYFLLTLEDSPRSKAVVFRDRKVGGSGLVKAITIEYWGLYRKRRRD